MEAKPIYKSADELGIEQWEHDGLAALVGPLSRGELDADFDMEVTCEPWSTPGPSYTFPHRRRECGTVACIGGHLALRAGLKNSHMYVINKKITHTTLLPLFYPGNLEDEEHAGWRANGAQAARAVVNFLMLGDPRWDDVMRDAG